MPLTGKHRRAERTGELRLRRDANWTGKNFFQRPRHSRLQCDATSEINRR